MLKSSADTALALLSFFEDFLKVSSIFNSFLGCFRRFLKFFGEILVFKKIKIFLEFISKDFGFCFLIFKNFIVVFWSFEWPLEGLEGGFPKFFFFSESFQISNVHLVSEKIFKVFVGFF